VEIRVGVVASLLGVIVGGLLQQLAAQHSLKLQHEWDVLGLFTKNSSQLPRLRRILAER
jgi:hypothetical protein